MMTHTSNTMRKYYNVWLFFFIILPFASNRSAQTFLRPKRARLAGETCTFDRQNMHSYTRKPISLDRELRP